MSKKNSILLLVIILIIILILVGYCLAEFYNDYKCSTTQDVEYFKKNNCMRFVK